MFDRAWARRRDVRTSSSVWGHNRLFLRGEICSLFHSHSSSSHERGKLFVRPGFNMYSLPVEAEFGAEWFGVEWESVTARRRKPPVELGHAHEDMSRCSLPPGGFLFAGSEARSQDAAPRSLTTPSAKLAFLVAFGAFFPLALLPFRTALVRCHRGASCQMWPAPSPFRSKWGCFARDEGQHSR